MSFIINILEDIELWVVNRLLAEKNSDVTEKLELLERKQESLNYQKTDLIFLTKKGFELNVNNNSWVKTETFDYGKYPGRYRIEISFPSEYPKTPPIIKAFPLGSINYTSHILSGNRVCIAQYKGSDQPNSYWKKNMNAKGALLLAYHVLTDEISSKKIRDVKSELSEKQERIAKQVEGMSEKLKDTIFESLMQVMTYQEFMDWYRRKYADDTDLENCNTWLQVSEVYKGFKPQAKNALIKLYNAEKEKYEALQNESGK